MQCAVGTATSLFGFDGRRRGRARRSRSAACAPPALLDGHGSKRALAKRIGSTAIELLKLQHNQGAASAAYCTRADEWCLLC